MSNGADADGQKPTEEEQKGVLIDQVILPCCIPVWTRSFVGDCNQLGVGVGRRDVSHAVSYRRRPMVFVRDGLL